MTIALVSWLLLSPISFAIATSQRYPQDAELKGLIQAFQQNVIRLKQQWQQTGFYRDRLGPPNPFQEYKMPQPKDSNNSSIDQIVEMPHSPVQRRFWLILGSGGLLVLLLGGSWLALRLTMRMPGDGGARRDYPTKVE